MLCMCVDVCLLCRGCLYMCVYVCGCFALIAMSAVNALIAVNDVNVSDVVAVNAVTAVIVSDVVAVIVAVKGAVNEAVAMNEMLGQSAVTAVIAVSICVCIRVWLLCMWLQ
eukprot:GHVS01058675.1.p5 GENE.GHVS01058675.1~~GHVS01058675.1.p5  ORF type:complete len:111 (+),score=11.40 GHVS01058675.1:575-907(+)